MKRLSRRTLLRAAGISIALPTLDAMVDNKGWWLRKAGAATPPPVRVMAFHFPHGVVLSQWTPTTTGAGYALTPGLMPLADFQNDINVISNLNQLCWGKGPGGGHANGMPDFATGVVSIGTGAGGPSFDQVLAAELGAATKFRSLVGHREQPDGATEGATTAHMNNVSWAGPGMVAPADRDPMHFYSTLVSAIPAAMSTTTTGPTPEVLAAIARKKSVLDHVMNEIGSLQTHVGSVDKARLDNHLTSLREVERVATQMPTTAPSNLSCVAPPAPTADEIMSYSDRTKIYSRLFALAFRCDLTRYASMAQSNGYDSRVYTDLTGNIGDHHGITHNGNYGPMPPTVEMKFVTYFMQQLAFLLNELKSTSEGAGTLLDNCLIYYGSEMGEGWHVAKQMPVVLAGKAGGKVQTGRHLMFPADTPLSKLFLSILQLAGSKTTTFGLGGTAPLDGLAS
ncbi:MAG TPA: DUF1552 domain-containing protein [Polyangia bacterium]|nr:DUF1552 domain-containing protein [Polyangia bacterium]